MYVMSIYACNRKNDIRPFPVILSLISRVHVLFLNASYATPNIDLA